MSNKVYDIITKKIIKALEEAQGSPGKWSRPWKAIADATSNGGPWSIKGRSYRGSNVLTLAFAAMEKGFDADAPWATYKGWKEIGAQVQKGEKGEFIVWWKFGENIKKDENGDETKTKYAICRGFTVFNAAQVEGFDLASWKAKHDVEALPPPKLTWADHAATEAALGAYLKGDGLSIRHMAQNRAYYSPSHDLIVMPTKEQFNGTGASGYYSTALHEAVHSTGHEKRLDRTFGSRFGDDAYAMEELVAEIGAAFLCGKLNVTDEPREDHDKYLSHWLKPLKADNRAIFTAASKAQAAADRIMGHSEEAEAEIPLAA